MDIVCEESAQGVEVLGPLRVSGALARLDPRQDEGDIVGHGSIEAGRTDSVVVYGASALTEQRRTAPCPDLQDTGRFGHN
ncbi:hypothetical protein GCM10009826_46480 [Humibacillus xanthopallidus]